MNANSHTRHLRLTLPAHRIGKQTDAQRTRQHGRIENQTARIATFGEWLVRLGVISGVMGLVWMVVR